MAFVSNLGGTLGLFLGLYFFIMIFYIYVDSLFNFCTGISLLSLVEIFQIVCECFSILVDRKVHPEEQKEPIKKQQFIEPTTDKNQNQNQPNQNSSKPAGETNSATGSTANMIANSSYA